MFSSFSFRFGYRWCQYRWWDFSLTVTQKIGIWVSFQLAWKAILHYNRNLGNSNRLSSLAHSSNVFLIAGNMLLWCAYAYWLKCIEQNIQCRNRIVWVCLKLSCLLAFYDSQPLSRYLKGCQRLVYTNHANIFLQCYIFWLDQRLEFSLGDLWSHQRRNLGVRIGLIIFSCIIEMCCYLKMGDSRRPWQKE